MSKRENAYSGRQHERGNADLTMSTEQEVEKLVGEIGSIIRAAEPERRGELKELAETLVHEEMSMIPAQVEPAKDYFAQRSVNPLAGGILLTLLGAGFALIIAPVGVGLMLIGLFLVIWGAIMSWAKK
ncbi:MAG TPA: hypothetical protein VGW77_25055 [Candidatus Binatia bacterium]|jgi:hypothetical protein|nr:hypothetical protein [Candidatus Binatia bacterium]